MEIKFNYRKEVTPELLFSEANRKLNANESLEEVIDMLYAISKDYPNFGKVYNHLGWIFETKFRDYAKAEENYKMALDLSPDYPAIYENYAYTLERLGKLDEMEALLKKGLDQPATNKEAIHRLYGRLHELKGDFDKAIVEFRHAITNSFSNDDINELEEGIKRCEKKKALLRTEE